jgi:DNA-binding NarL/FixJ family response regulator
MNERDRQIMTLVAQGRSNKQIAAEMYLSIETIKTHLSRIYADNGYRNRVQAAVDFTCGPDRVNEAG